MSLDEILATLTHGELPTIANELLTFQMQKSLPDGLIKNTYLPKMSIQSGDPQEGKVYFDHSQQTSYLENMQNLIEALSQIILNDYVTLKKQQIQQAEQNTQK